MTYAFNSGKGKNQTTFERAKKYEDVDQFAVNDNHDMDYVWLKFHQNPLKTSAVITFLLKSPFFWTARDDVYPKSK